MFKEMLLKKMMASQLKDVPKEKQDQIISAIESNPELFEKIALSIKKKVDEGVDQMTAAMEVVGEHQEELTRALKGRE